jgi:hypothetical protein
VSRRVGVVPPAFWGIGYSGQACVVEAFLARGEDGVRRLLAQRGTVIDRYRCQLPPSRKGMFP